uniref:RecD helicase /ATP-dependent exoDNAse n=1 Tax=Marseillevirus LCMAC103 TaxID=2506604 RepID=A0A481YVK0_9VIRU|nr:MAG: RecD helicase /ATP-dependent exoDNAse [Marseillevirus LCMAC103]
MFFSQYECVLEAIHNKWNILLHGPGGCGKTYTIAKLINALTIANPDAVIACTALTGVAAANLRGSIPVDAQTLHRWAGVQLAHGPADQLVRKLYRNREALDRWRTTDILFVDEISMLGKELFEKFDYIARSVRTMRKPFGGIQLVLSGDFLQLPPVDDEWVFTSRRWAELDLVPYIFEDGVGKRYDDPAFFAMLLRARVGKLTADDARRLAARDQAYRDYLSEEEAQPGRAESVKPTLLFPTNRDADIHNSGKLAELDTPVRTYAAADVVNVHPRARQATLDQLDKIIPARIDLRVGAQVMLRANLDVAAGLTNGSRGVVVDLGPEWVLVRFLDGKEANIAPHCWEHVERRRRRAKAAADPEAKTADPSETTASRSQIPLILAWAFTIHKSQSCTINFAIVRLGSAIFAYGQAYVALSRVVNYNSLFLIDFTVDSIFADEAAVAYARQLREDTPVQYE